MLKLLKSHIEQLNYKNEESLKDLDKWIGISVFVVEDDSRSVHPLQPEYVKAMTALNSISETDFDKKKFELISIIDTLIEDKNKLGANKDMGDILYGEGKHLQQKKIKMAFLIVEQNHIDYFKERKSHLPSQPHDRLYSHYLTHDDGNNYTFAWLDTSDLPSHIKDEALNALSGILGNPKN